MYAENLRPIFNKRFWTFPFSMGIKKMWNEHEHEHDNRKPGMEKIEMLQYVIHFKVLNFIQLSFGV